MTPDRDDAGKYTADATTGDALRVFEQTDGPAITAADVASALECSRDVARKRLDELHERGLVERRMSGRTVLWWRVERDDYERAFGAYADTDVDEGMREVRRQLREEWEA